MYVGINVHWSEYENISLLGDFNSSMLDSSMKALKLANSAVLLKKVPVSKP